ncbi:LysR family transcriptional regulator [Pseudomonas sp. NPDC089554]|uniref:LysR family transcriptional regulator n=1 Tax=Pseudomonas sp. NPDC089554 TaxID=3390653 RepID=UPI003CFE9D4C
MDLETLETFVEVADTGGISQAAQRLGVSKSIVSRRLSRLEAELGTQLLARSTRGAALTEAGATFRDHAAKVCAEIDSAREAILPNGPLRGRLRVAVPVSFGPTFAPMLAEMARRHPELTIQTCYSDRFVDLIGEGFDCGIRVGYLPDSNLVIAKRIGPVYTTLVASPAYLKAHGAPQSPEALGEHQALMQSTETWQFLDGDKVVTGHPQGRFKADNGRALVDAAVAGLGIAYLPDCLIQEHLNAGALVPIMTAYPPPPAGAYVVRLPGQHPARKIRLLTELLIELFGETLHAPAPVAR